MLGRIPDRSIWLVYLTILVLGVSYGLAVSLVGLLLEERRYEKDAIGLLATFFAAGIVASAVPSGALIRRFGSKVVLVVSLVGYAASVAAFPYMPTFFGLGAMRFFDGAFSVGVWVSSETILLARAPRGDKAFFMSLYAISLALGYVIGPVLSWAIVAGFPKSASFVAAGALAVGAAAICGALLDPARVGDASPEDDASGDGAPQLGAAQVFWRIKTSCLATFSYGYFQASVAIFLPLYLIGQGMTERETIIVPAFFAAGMLLCSVPAARLGDRLGHLAVMRALGTIGTATIVSFLFARHEAVVYGLVFVAGAALASVSPVSLALQGLVVEPRDLPRAGGLYNASYALGMLVGPPISGRLFAARSGDAMILHFAIIWVGFVAATIVWRRDDPRAKKMPT